MNNYKEYLDPDNGYVLIQQTQNIPFSERWIEVPDGAEYFILMRTGLKVGVEFFFKYIDGEFMLYRDSDWLSASYDCAQDYVDEGDEVLWSRKVNQEQGLISGVDALRALADGKEVEAFVEYKLGIKEWQDAKNLPICDVLNNGFDFRLKPRTVKLEIEVPAPFEPKEFEDCYILSDLYEHGYTKTSWKYGESVPVWRTEAEIKIVVKQLRKIKEHSK